MILAKDPISFIREFSFKVFKPNVGSSANSSVAPRNLTISLNTVNSLNELMVPEVYISSENYVAANQVADWLVNDPRYKVYPYAAVNDLTCAGQAISMMHVVFADPNLNTQVVADELNYLIQHVVKSVAAVKNGDAKLVRPKAEWDAMNEHNTARNGWNQQTTIGQSPQGVNRQPSMGGSRMPVQPNNAGGNPNPELWIDNV